MPCFDSDVLSSLQNAYNRAVAALSPADEMIGEHVREVIAQAVMSAAKEGLLDSDVLANQGALAGRRVLQAERFLPTAA